MKRFSLTLTAALLLCGAIAFAGDKSAKANDSKADVKATAKTEAAAIPAKADAKADDDPLYIYYVTGTGEDENGNPIYDVTTTPQTCPGGSNPCKVESNQEMVNGTIPQDAVTKEDSHQGAF